MLLYELVEEACCAVNHSSSLGLLSLGSSHCERIIHMTFFMEYGLRIEQRRSQHITLTNITYTVHVDNSYCCASKKDEFVLPFFLEDLDELTWHQLQRMSTKDQLKRVAQNT